MSKTKLVIAVALTGVVVWTIISAYGSEAALIERFPDLDPKLVVKAHRQMCRLALKQDATIINAVTDGDYDNILRSIVATY